MEISDRLTHHLRRARRVVFLTGAGVSAESGIPTFRDALSDTAHWTRFSPEQLASMDGFRRDPTMVQGWYAERIRTIRIAQPNPGHIAIANMQNRYEQTMVVTQNVDGLHQRAGTRDVLELHGNIHSQRCAACGAQGPVSFADVDDEHLPLRCETCDDLMRPNVVWFGEELPQATFRAAEEAVAAADLVFSVGTSAVVYPASSLIGIASRHGAYVVEVNISPSDAAYIADEVIVGESGAVLPVLGNQHAPSAGMHN